MALYADKEEDRKARLLGRRRTERKRLQRAQERAERQQLRAAAEAERERRWREEERPRREAQQAAALAEAHAKGLNAQPRHIPFDPPTDFEPLPPAEPEYLTIEDVPPERGAAIKQFLSGGGRGEVEAGWKDGVEEHTTDDEESAELVDFLRGGER